MVVRTYLNIFLLSDPGFSIEEITTAIKKLLEELNLKTHYIEVKRSSVVRNLYYVKIDLGDIELKTEDSSRVKSKIEEIINSSSHISWSKVELHVIR